MGHLGITVTSACSVRHHPFHGLKSWLTKFEDPNGILGPLVINGPTSMNYDIDLGPVLISDYFHADAFSLYQFELLGVPPTPDSVVLNGRGPYYCNPDYDWKCTGEVPRTSFNFTSGKTYKMSIVNTALSTHFTFWIDGHTFSVVGTDFVPIKPYDTDTINVAIGKSFLRRRHVQTKEIAC